MSEHEKLRDAIKWGREYLSGGSSAGYLNNLAALIDAAESLLPKTKMVEGWQVEWCVGWTNGGTGRWHTAPVPNPSLARSAYYTKAEADAHAARLSLKSMHKCIRVTGPHQQEVPA